jgi:hypothetical protein
MSQLKFVSRRNIDETQWNNCVANSFNPFPYAYAWYLDAVAENWDALVIDEYKIVMPLVWMRKFGVKGLYQPYYCQQLGLFSNAKISQDDASLMLDYANKNYGFLNINLNSSVQDVQQKYKLIQRKNLILELSKIIEEVRKKYSQNHKRNIAKALKNGVTIKRDTSLEEFQKFYVGNVNPNKEVFKPKHRKVFEKITTEIITRKMGFISSAHSSTGEIVAAILCVSDNQRCINLINTSSVSGKNTGAMHLLIDALIEDQIGKTRIFDFEGSSIPSIARFYAGFGASEDPYFLLESLILQRAKQLFR